MLSVSLVHQFIWPTFTLVFTRNGIFKYSQKPWMRLKLTMTSIFIMSGRGAFRGLFRIEANQTSKVELYPCMIASWTVEGCEAFSHKVPSSMLDCVWIQIGFNITYLWKVVMGSINCTIERTGMLKPLAAKHDDWKQKMEEIKIRRLNQVKNTHSQVKKISKLRI